MIRITVEEVKAAYAKSGLKPKTGIYCSSDGAGCAIGALICAKAGKIHFDTGDEITNLADEITNRYGKHYLYGFLRGFDGLPTNGSEGAEDGKACREAILGLVE